MAYWIFKTNPEHYRIDDRLRDPEPAITWRVTRYRDEIRPDDIAFIWRAGPNPRGICAIMRITSAPKQLSETPAERKYDIKPDTGVLWRVHGKLIERFRCIESSVLKNDSRLRNLSVFHGYQATTNFRVDDMEAAVLLELVRRQTPLTQPATQ